MADAIMRMPQVCETVQLSAPTIYRMIKAGTFPAQIKLGAHASGWLESAVQEWIKARAAQQDQQAS